MIFLDADGTLFHPMGYIPESAKQAISLAKKNGHYICLCTGRQKAEIYGDLAKIAYDGIVVGSGAFVQAKQHILCDKCFSQHQIQTLVDYFSENHIPCIYESNEAVYGDAFVLQELDRLIHAQLQHLTQEEKATHGLTRLKNSIHLETEENIRKASINKISFLASHIPFKDIYAHFHKDFDVIQATFAPLGKESGELARKDISKGSGMNYLINYYHVHAQDVIAIGDGFNDIKMFENAHISIAMGNAPKEIQDVCDMVTSTIDEDGIYHAFQKLNIL